MSRCILVELVRCCAVVLAFFAAGAGAAAGAGREGFVLNRGESLYIEMRGRVEPVARTAERLLMEDLREVAVVSGATAAIGADAVIEVSVDSCNGAGREGFRLCVEGDGRLKIMADDSHGAAYGLLEVSRLAGVSPWKWWADASPTRLERFVLDAGFSVEQRPDVEYRGIFINDEDWGMMPWAAAHESNGEMGRIGPETYRRIFELLLRLRANTVWPAMHECTRPFFLVAGNREAAREYGIYIGSSHCEPMGCNAAGEWRVRGEGKYDYVNNRENVLRFWEERVKETAGQDMVYTIGMRGLHDSAMAGVKSKNEHKSVLEDVIKTQRWLIEKYVDAKPERVPQVFIPYKEVLDIYNDGLAVPDDVTLMWTDDNYGYIRHFPTPDEARRGGGNGIYYHVSYWGRPHDYLWLGTFSPGLLHRQMSLAYEKGIRKMWILNVGDLKPAEYQTELFLDMAWDMHSNSDPDAHLHGFLVREFGDKAAERLMPVMLAHYRLAFVRKPEFMGNTRTEERRNPLANVVKDLPFSAREVERRIDGYRSISDEVDELSRVIPADKRDEYYQLVEYPVKGAAQMNFKALGAMKARHGIAGWEPVRAAHDSIAALTARYNSGYDNGGKWSGIMDCAPRGLAVFAPYAETGDSVPTALPEGDALCVIEGTSGRGDFVTLGNIGYYGKCASLKQGKTVEYTLDVPECSDSRLAVELRMLPTHRVGDADPGVEVSLDGDVLGVMSYATKGRSEEWKENVLSNNACRRVALPRLKPGRYRLGVTAVGEGVVMDHIRVVRE